MCSTAEILQTQRVGDTLVVLPLTDLLELDYSRIDVEAASVLELFELTQTRNVVLDLRHADFTGSSAIGYFVKLWKRVQGRGGRMALCHVSEHERQILRVCRLDTLWPICDSRTEALAAVRGGATG